MARSTVPAVAPVQYFVRILGPIHVEEDKKNKSRTYGWCHVELLEKGMVGCFKYWDGNVKTLLSLSHGQCKVYKDFVEGDIIFVMGRLMGRSRGSVSSIVLQAINVTPIVCKNYTAGYTENKDEEGLDEVPL